MTSRLILVLMLTFGFCEAALAARHALVVGNASYEVGKLNNPVNDARGVARALEALDFEVQVTTNCSGRYKHFAVSWVRMTLPCFITPVTGLRLTAKTIYFQ